MIWMFISYFLMSVTNIYSAEALGTDEFFEYLTTYDMLVYVLYFPRLCVMLVFAEILMNWKDEVSKAMRIKPREDVCCDCWEMFFCYCFVLTSMKQAVAKRKEVLESQRPLIGAPATLLQGDTSGTQQVLKQE